MAPAKKSALKKEGYQFSLDDLLEKVKRNLILSGYHDDELLEQKIRAALYAAAKRQHKAGDYYLKNPMPPSTEEAVIMWVSHLYESRDGSTGGFFSDSTAAAAQARIATNDLLALDKEWIV